MERKQASLSKSPGQEFKAEPMSFKRTVRIVPLYMDGIRGKAGGQTDRQMDT